MRKSAAAWRLTSSGARTAALPSTVCRAAIACTDRAEGGASVTAGAGLPFVGARFEEPAASGFFSVSLASPPNPTHVDHRLCESQQPCGKTFGQKVVSYWAALTPLEDDDRDLALCQGLLLLDVGHEALELFPLPGRSGPRADFELIGAHLDGRDRARQQILVPAGMRWGAVPGRNDDVAIAIFPEAEHRYPFLAGFRAGRRQQYQCAAGHLPAQLPTIRAELLDQLAIERVHVRRDLRGRLPMGRLFGTHDLTWIIPTQFFPGSMNHAIQAKPISAIPSTVFRLAVS